MKKSYLLLIPVALAFVVYGAFFYKTQKFNQQLPFFGAIKIDSISIDGKYKKDTLYHRIPDFKLLDQAGEVVTQANFNGKIYVTDFFFTTCKSICPIMTNHMKEVVEHYKD